MDKFKRKQSPTLFEDLTKTKQKSNINKDLFGSDSDSTAEPDPSEWEKYFGKSPKTHENSKETPCSSNANKSNLKVGLQPKQKNAPLKLQKRTSNIHEISDSDSEDDKRSKARKPNLSNQSQNSTSDKQNKAATTMLIEKPGSSRTTSNKTGVEFGDKCTTKTSLKRKHTEVLDDENSDGEPKSNKTMCKYGSKCYRKNPSHLADFFHPKNEESRNYNSSPSPLPRKKPCIDTGNAKHSPSTNVVRSGSVFDLGKPYSFFLTKVSGIKDCYNTEYAMGIKDILSEKMGNLQESCQFDYMFEIPWLMKQYPDKFRTKPLLLVHGFQGPSKAALESEGAAYKNIRFCQARLEMPYGTHHTKMMFLLYDTGMRIVIHTSNLIERDWHQKTQGMWISDVFPKLNKPSATDGDSPTNFKQDLLEYVSSYKAYQLKDWKDHIYQHDFSTAKVVIVASVPGRHTDNRKGLFGHMKLRKTLHNHGPEKALVRNWPVIGQFSSIGSLGATKENWLCTEFLQSFATVNGTSAVPLSATPLQLIFPTKDNVRTSLEGYPAGASIPYSINVAKKQPYLHKYMCKWKSEGRGRSRAMPHIKTFGRPSLTGDDLAWYLVTSANLSKAAWGALEKKNSQLMIRSYEIGVMFLPKFFDKATIKCTSSLTEVKNNRDMLVLPYDLPAKPHTQEDRPWIWDIQYRELPDTNANMWCPS